jgi:hypothetical protein
MRFERKLGVAQLLSLLALCFFVAVTRGSPSAFFDFTPRSVPFVPSVIQREEGRIDVSKRDVDCAFFPQPPSLLLLTFTLSISTTQDSSNYPWSSSSSCINCRSVLCPSTSTGCSTSHFQLSPCQCNTYYSGSSGPF